MNGSWVRISMNFQYGIDDCDVADKSRLRQYREKRTGWLYMLAGDPDHAVSKQITAMLWNDAVFRVANESRRLSRLGGYKSSARNWSIAQFMDQGFVAVQTLSIRRLMDKAASKPARQVISLRRVLDDIKAHRELITREDYVAYDGLPYNPEPGERAYMESLVKRGGGVHTQWLPTTGPQAWSVSQMVHERFDKLSGVAHDQRSPSDVIADDVFDKIEAMLTKSGWQDIAEFGNKFIAHAADEHSRSTLLDGQNGFSLDKLARCHEGICRAAAAIYGPILWEGSSGLLPIPQFNHFDNLEAAWLLPQDIETLSAFWDAHVENVESWIEGDPFEEKPD
ncbi:hypothetical protein KIP88_38615 [Bradyrhizobium sp. SRL28]|uniref:hypothetical protein n=1 Tax=Bradyrhizobium sp. SRL28 TaxID=2836178 RepID=UPI001BDE496E|nr:hypothetical protein [Bradyrhizobium sp. SRL28]MBT1516369.1 hypothetical protein [Bradyrhizobium sp. SRL28]